MKTKAFFLEFTVIFLITFAMASIVSYCWNFFIHGSAVCSWGIALKFAVMFAVICPLIDLMKSEGKVNEEWNNN